MKIVVNIIEVLSAVVLLSLVSVGCISSHPGSSSLAYVEIKDASMEEVVRATKQVFSAELYKLTKSTGDFLVFEQEATRQDAVLWGNYEGDLKMRVEVTVQPINDSITLLRADAFTVRGDNGRVDALRPIAKRPYKGLMKSVRSQVKKNKSS